MQSTKVQQELSDLFETSIADLSLHSRVFLDISLDVEIEKQDEEHSPMEEDDVAVLLGEITLNEEREGGMNEEGGKLDKLHCGQISEIITSFHSI